MVSDSRSQQVNLGCGTLIIIALIVLIFSGRGTDDLERQVGHARTEVGDLEREVKGLRAEMVDLRKSVDAQAAEIRQLRERLPPPPKPADPKGKG